MILEYFAMHRTSCLSARCPRLLDSKQSQIIRAPLLGLTVGELFEFTLGVYFSLGLLLCIVTKHLIFGEL